MFTDTQEELLLAIRDMAENRCVVTLHKGVDTARFCEEMTATYGNDFIPNRSVELVNEKVDSVSNFDFVLTDDEFQVLKNDPRVRDVRWGSKAENGFEKVDFVIEEERRFLRNDTQSALDYDWGKPACTTTGARPSLFKFAYTLTGKNVDVIINDSGAYGIHPEFADANGNSRLIEYDWTQHGGSQISYSSYGSGHGVHVAGTTLGKLYGWAKDANYYFNNYSNTGNGLNQMRLFHQTKGNGFPTIVNQSWGYIQRYATSGAQYSTTYRGTEYVIGTNQAQYGQIRAVFDGFGYRHPSRVTSVDSDQEDLIAAGVIVVGAAGNYYHKIDVPGGLDYDNYYQTTNGGDEIYYHRGSSPVATPGTICVGSIDSQYQGVNTEQVAVYTEVGPRIDVFAPGTDIQSAIPVGSSIETAYGGVAYPGNATYNSVKISGTSMASPQVCGVLACLLEARPYYTTADCLAWLQNNAVANILYDPSTGTPSTDYQNYRALQGAPNRYLFNPFNRAESARYSGSISLSG